MSDARFNSCNLGSLDLSNNLTLYWDGQKLWLPKAIIFYNNGYVSDLSATAYSHYSFLGSLLWAFFWKVSSFEYEYFGRIFFLAIYCFALFNFEARTILFFSSFGNSLSDRQTKISGLIPSDLNSLTECCVGSVSYTHLRAHET